MQNLLLAAMDSQERDVLAPHLETVAVRAGDALLTAANEAAWVYFPEDAVATLIMGDARANGEDEVITIGREGLLGFPQAVLGGPSEVSAVVRIAGSATRVAASRFRELLGTMPGLRTQLDQYTRGLTLQLARAVVCERRHSIEQRLSTLILLTHDRVGGSQMQLTHEQLGDMLGVRRAGVTEVATKLRSQSAIDYRRGRLNVSDREHLMKSACGCYEAMREQFDLTT